MSKTLFQELNSNSKYSISLVEKLYSPLKNRKELVNHLVELFNFDEKVVFEDVYHFYSNLITKYSYGEKVIKSTLIDNYCFACDGFAFEVPLIKSRLDLLTFNKRYSFGFEIKSKFDSLDKLEKQLNDYSQVVDLLYVVIDISHLEKVLKSISDNFGIIVFEKDSSEENKIYIYRDALINKTNPVYQLNFMAKSERFKFFNDYESNSILQNFGSSYIQSCFIETLQKRYLKKSSFLKLNKDKIQKIDYQYFPRI